jgi:hypothetical protein
MKALIYKGYSVFHGEAPVCCIYALFYLFDKLN